MARYYTAEVCLNGHSTTDEVERSPERREKFCSRCGAETITQCPNCGTGIRGYLEFEAVLSLQEYMPPRFCYACGKTFPWTERRLEAAKEFADELDGLTDDEKVKLKGSLGDLLADTPRTELAAMRYKKFIGKAGKEAAGAMRDMVIDVISETAKKLIFGA